MRKAERVGWCVCICKRVCWAVLLLAQVCVKPCVEVWTPPVNRDRPFTHNTCMHAHAGVRTAALDPQDTAWMAVWEGGGAGGWAGRCGQLP